MVIDRFQPDWQLQLAQWHVALPEGLTLFMLIDGAFVPGVFRRLHSTHEPILLFDSLPGCNDNTRDVSPFLIPYNPLDQSLAQLLRSCDRYPMVSAIVTNESVERLGQRLANWCVVEADGLRFNFRFPDTRRISAIFKVLTGSQRQAFVGGARSWAFVGRNGKWQHLPLEVAYCEASPTEQAHLDERQFAALVADSEADEIWTRLLDRGVSTDLLPSQRHAALSNALHVAGEAAANSSTKLRWCAQCITSFPTGDVEKLRTEFTRWLREQTLDEEKISPDIA